MRLKITIFLTQGVTYLPLSHVAAQVFIVFNIMWVCKSEDSKPILVYWSDFGLTMVSKSEDRNQN